ncbi:PHD finger protein [Glycine soja]|nr:PHD finger protein [Glycine soja]
MEDAVPDPQPEEQPQRPPPLLNGYSDERCAKKPKFDEGAELKRVAEIVLVLSTMATVRAGRKPSDAEVELMREARAKLASLCEGLAPKDIVAGEAIGTVIEDLGLNSKLKDQRLGFRTPKMSIAERYSHAKWKMEEAKKFSASSTPSTTHTSQPLQTNIGGPVDNRVPSHVVRIFPSDKSSHPAIPSMGTVVPIPAHVSAGSSAALQYQVTGNEVRPPVVSGVMPSSHLGRNSSSLALPKVERPQFKVDGGSNGSPYMLQVQANSSANQPLVNAPTWSIQTQAASLARSASENKVPVHNSVKVEGTPDATVSRAGTQITTDSSFRPFITQTAPGNLPSVHQPLQATNIVQAPLIPSHTDIAKIVQKVLQPKLPVHPTWTPPSRDYMNKAFTCQMCELSVNEVDTVLLCDACEKGFHLKCLQPSVLRGIHNRVDWHCMRCLSLSGGKPLPPKYGRVMRSSNTPPKLPSNTGGVQPCSEKKVENIDPKVIPQTLATNGSSVPTVSGGHHNVELPSESKIPDTKDMQGTGISSTIEAIDKKPDPKNSMKSLSAAYSPSPCLLGENSAQQINSKVLTGRETSESESLPKLSELAKCENLQSSQDFQVEHTMSQDNAEVSSDKHVDSNMMNNQQKESHGEENLVYDIKRDDQDAALENSVGTSGTNTDGRQHSALSSDSSHAVEWIGDVVQLVDEKKYYQSCCVDGSMWEDCKTGLKWVKVTNCYFPDDLPGNIGHPCISEVNEVYESNSDRTEMASSIRGPCEVLPSDKFKQENDRRCQLRNEESSRVQPIFLCSGQPQKRYSGWDSTFWKPKTEMKWQFGKERIAACTVLAVAREEVLSGELNVGEERRAACTVLAVVRRRGHLWCGVNVIFTTNPTLLLNNTSAGGLCLNHEAHSSHNSRWSCDCGSKEFGNAIALSGYLTTLDVAVVPSGHSAAIVHY